MENKYIIRSESELEAVIGMPMNAKEKIVPRLSCTNRISSATDRPISKD